VTWWSASSSLFLLVFSAELTCFLSNSPSLILARLLLLPLPFLMVPLPDPPPLELATSLSQRRKLAAAGRGLRLEQQQRYQRCRCPRFLVQQEVSHCRLRLLSPFRFVPSPYYTPFLPSLTSHLRRTPLPLPVVPFPLPIFLSFLSPGP
jgi:hypothetical protein